MTEQHRVLFLTDRGQWHQHAVLAAAPPELCVTMLRRPTREQLMRRLPEAEFLVSERSGEIDAEMIATGTELRLIQRLGSLTHDIDLDAARAAGIPVSAWPVLGCVMVAEHMVAQMLALAKRLNDAAATANAAGDWGQPSRRTDEDTFAYDWSRRPGIRQIYGETIGILGFGEIGAELARRLRGFAPAGVFYHKRNRLPEHTEVELGITFALIEQIVVESDFLANLLPYSPDTDGYIGAGFLAAMKPGAFLVSCGSGSVIDEAALAQALRAGHPVGAALDTFEWEPIRPDNPLLPLAQDPQANVLLTPHTAGGSSSTSEDINPRAEDYENIVRMLCGQPLRHRVV